MNIQIVPYQATFEQPLLNILQQNVPTYFAQDEVDDLREYLNHHIDLYYVVLCDETLIGGGGINRTLETKLGALTWAFLHPDYHRKGIGAMLLNYRLAILKEDPNVKIIRVRTSQVVHQFFAKNGFTIQKTEKDYWAKGLDLYEMIYSK